MKPEELIGTAGLKALTDAGFEVVPKQPEKKEFELPKPETGSIYYYIDAFGAVKSDSWFGLHGDNHILEVGNVFPTKEAAKQEVERKRNKAKLQAAIKQLNGDWEPDWNNDKEEKFYITYSHLFKVFEYISFTYFQYESIPMKKNFIPQLIEMIGEETIIKALGVKL